MVGKGECMPRFTYVLGDVIILRGGISDQTRVRYLCDANPANGWNTELKFDDANWHESRTPIGSRKYFTRTDVRFSDLYIRKVFSADEVPRNAVLKIASDEGAEAWVNGHKVLSDISARHWASYWNYRLDITDFLKRGKNLLAFHVKRYEDVEEYGAGCFFDFELIFRKRSMEEIIFDFVKGRLSPDGGFSDDSIHSTFCAVSALKALDSIDVLDKDKVALWILLRKSVYGYFRDDGASIGAQHSAVETLKNLGLRLDDESSERLANLIISRREDDGRWSEFLWVDLEVTHRAIEALASLDALGRVKDWNKTIDWIKSLQGKDGGFSSKPGGSASLLSTFFAIRSLQLLNAMDIVNKEKAIEFIKSCYRNGGFDDTPEEMEEEKEWLAYSGVKSLEILNALNEVDPEAIANRVVSWLRDKWSIWGLNVAYEAVMTLKALNKLNMLDKAETVDNIIKFHNPIDGGFKSVGNLEDTEHALSILQNMDMLNKVDTEKVKQWILSKPFNFYHGETSRIHSAVYCLKALDVLKEVDVEKIVGKLLKHQPPDGGFGLDGNWRKSNLRYTYLAIDTLHMLNRVSSVDKERAVNYILSLKNPDGSFNESRDEGMSARAAPLAVITLNLLGEISVVDEKTVNSIVGEQMHDGSFRTLENTYYSLLALQYLGRLDGTVLSKAVNYVLSLQNLDGGFGWEKGNIRSSLKSTDYAVGILKIARNLRI